MVSNTVKRPKSNPPEGLDALLARPAFQAMMARFLEGKSAVTPPQIPGVVRELSGLNSAELVKLLEILGVSYWKLRRAGKVASGPATPAVVTKLLADRGHRSVAGLPRTNLALARAIREGERIAGERERSASAEQLRRELVVMRAIRSAVMALPPQPLRDRIGFNAQLGVGVRLFKYKGEGRSGFQADNYREQGGLFPSPFPKLTDHLHPRVGAALNLRITDKVRGRKRKVQLFAAFPTTNLTYFGTHRANNIFGSPSGWGWTAQGPGGFKPSLGWDPVIGKNFQMSRQMLGSIMVAERILKVTVHLPEKLRRGIPIPGTSGGKLVPNIGIGVEGDWVYHVTGPILGMLMGLGELVREIPGVERLKEKVRRRKESDAVPLNPVDYSDSSRSPSRAEPNPPLLQPITRSATRAS